jgi:hypothetical protein
MNKSRMISGTCSRHPIKEQMHAKFRQQKTHEKRQAVTLACRRKNNTEIDI